MPPTVGTPIEEPGTGVTTYTETGVTIAAGQVAIVSLGVRDVDSNVTATCTFGGAAAPVLLTPIYGDSICAFGWSYDVPGTYTVIATTNEAQNGQMHIVIADSLSITTPLDAASGTSFTAVTALSHSVTTETDDLVLAFFIHRQTTRTLALAGSMTLLANDTSADAVTNGVRQVVGTRTGNGSVACEGTLSATTAAIVWAVNINQYVAPPSGSAAVIDRRRRAEAASFVTDMFFKGML